jgi:hypothetical protein
VRMLVPQAPDSMPAARPDRVWWHALTECPFLFMASAGAANANR